MKLAVTGATGFLGRYVLEALNQRGVSYVTLGRRPPGDGCPFAELDLLAPGDLRPLLERVGATHLVHLAWYAEHGHFWHSPFNAQWAVATGRLVEAFCQTGGSHVVGVGTCAEYDWSGGYCHEERTRVLPRTRYGVSKDATRRLVALECDAHGLTWAWGRVFWLHGVGEHPDRLVPAVMAGLAGRRAPFSVFADAYRDFLHVSDVAGAIVTLLEGTGTYNVCSGEPVRIGDLVRALARLSNTDAEVILRLSKPRPDEPEFLVGDNARLRGLGWHPRLDLAAGLERSLRADGAPS